MKKVYFFKTLLVAVGLMGSLSAWASTHYIVNENFNNRPNVWNKAVDGVTYTLYTGSDTDYFVYQAGRSSGHNAIWYSPTRDWNDDIIEYTAEFDFKTSVNTSYKVAEIALLDANSKVSGRMDTNGFLTTSTNGGNNIFYAASTAVENNVTTYTIYGTDQSELGTFTMANGTWYHFALTINKTSKVVSYTITANGKDIQSNTYISPSTTGICTGIFIRTPRSGNISFDNLVITDEVDADVATSPSIELTGLNGTERTYTITYLPGETLHYTLPNENEQTVSTGSSKVVSTNTSGTLVAWTTNGTATSTEATVTVDAINVALSAPSINVSGMATNSSRYNAILDARNDQSNVLLQPVATQTATFTPDGGDVVDVDLPYTATEKGVLTVTASASGYTSASAIFSIEKAYLQSWQSLDFSSLIGEEAVQAALGNTWSLQSGHGRWASWNKTKDGSYNFYATSTNGNSRNFNGNIYFRDVVVLAEGMGLGRNTTGGEPIAVSNTVAGQIVAFEIYNGYGNDISKGTNTYMSYVVSNGSDRPSMSSTNGALLVQATIYSPAAIQPLTSSANLQGYKTFYNALKSFEVDANTTIYKAAQVSGDKVIITAVEGNVVPAGEPVILKTTNTTDYSITLTETTEEGGDFTGNALQVADAAGTIDGAYILAYTTADGFGFYKFTGSLDAGDVYVTAAAGTKLRVAFADEASGIETIAADSAENGIIYNVAGQRVNAAYKGIVIKNGKKFLVR